MDCSKTEIFFKELHRLCKNTENCGECKLYEPCSNLTNIDNPIELIAIVQKWSDEHPLKIESCEGCKHISEINGKKFCWLPFDTGGGNVHTVHEAINRCDCYKEDMK